MLGDGAEPRSDRPPRAREEKPGRPESLRLDTPQLGEIRGYLETIARAIPEEESDALDALGQLQEIFTP